MADAIQGEADEEGKKYLGRSEKLDLTKYVNTDSFNEEDRQLLQQVRKLQDIEVNKYLNRNSPFSGIWENIIHTEGDELPDETKSLIAEYFHPKLKKIFEEQDLNNFIFCLPEKKIFKSDSLQETALSSQSISPVFKVFAKNNHFLLQWMIQKETN